MVWPILQSFPFRFGIWKEEMSGNIQAQQTVWCEQGSKANMCRAKPGKHQDFKENTDDLESRFGCAGTSYKAVPSS